MSRLMAFVDGENLTMRFEEMIKEGRKIRATGDPNQYNFALPVAYCPGKYVWSPATIRDLFQDENLRRVHYYTTFVGAHEDGDVLASNLSKLSAKRFSSLQGFIVGEVRLIPRIFKKTKRGTKTKSVDINICVDVMDYIANNALDAVYLVTGDVDYLPLINAVMRAGKRVYVASLSSGLSPRMEVGTDKFVSLNQAYFA